MANPSAMVTLFRHCFANAEAKVWTRNPERLSPTAKSATTELERGSRQETTQAERGIFFRLFGLATTGYMGVPAHRVIIKV